MDNKWLIRLKYWIKKKLGFRTRRSIPPIVKRWDNLTKDCTVMRIERDTVGAVATYRIVSLYGDYHYLITLDSLAELRAELNLELHLRAKYKVPVSLRRGTLRKPQTHRFGVFHILLDGRTDPVGIWDVDLVGFGNNANPYSNAPLVAIAGVALQCLVMPHYPQILKSWQTQMDQVNWLATLERKIRKELSNESHNLNAIKIRASLPNTKTEIRGD